MKQILAMVSRGCGAVLPILLVVSLSYELYDRYQQRHEQNQQTLEPSTPEPEHTSENE